MNYPPHRSDSGVSVVIPCFDEEGAIESTLRGVAQAMAGLTLPWEIIAVNDGSLDRTGQILDSLVGSVPNLRALHNPFNRGYGATLKVGISEAKYDRIVITDADGTYPNERIPELVAELEKSDMVVGARIGANVNIPALRRPVKWVLLQYARWLAGADIKDVNSGLRAVWIRHVKSVWWMLPNGFSFTTTITIASHVNRLHVKYMPIDYHKRVGKSSIRPIRDTTRFFFLIVRTIMFYRPLQVFGSFGIALIIAAILVAVIVKVLAHEVPDVITVALFTTGVNFLGLGLIGDLVNSHRVR